MWKTVKLGDLLEVQNGYAFNSKQFDVGGEMPLIRIRDLKNAVDTETRYTGDYDEKYLVSSGDLLIGMDGEFRCYEWRGAPALLNQRVCRLQNFHDDLNQRFLLYAINDELKKIEDVTGFTTVKHLSSKTIKEIKLRLPPLAEQQRIVAKLDAAFAEIDRAIDVAESKQSAVENLKAALLASALTGEDCRTVKLGSACEIQPKKAQVKEKLSDTDQVSFMPMDDLGIDRMYPKANQIKTLATAYGSYTYFEDNDVLLAKITPCFENGKLGIATKLKNGVGFGSSEYIVLRCGEEVLPQYIYYYLNQPSFRTEGKKQMSGAVGHKRVPKDFVENLEIPLPTLPEQQRIVAKLDAAFAEIEKSAESISEVKVNYLALKSAILAQELQPPESKAA